MRAQGLRGKRPWTVVESILLQGLLAFWAWWGYAADVPNDLVVVSCLGGLHCRTQDPRLLVCGTGKNEWGVPKLP